MIQRETARKLMIEKQHLSKKKGNTKKDVYDTIESLGCLQIDTISVVERAHYLTLWSRLGNYEKNHLDSLAYRDRRLFEHWAHAACYIPTEHYPYYIESMKQRKTELLPRLKRRTGKGEELIEHVIKRIKDEGPLSSKDFNSKKKQKGGWWNRKDEKIVMDYLYGAGVLAIERRENFQRYYDLVENVLPDWIDVEAPSDDDRVWFFIEKTMKCLGVLQPKEARDYYQHFAVKLGRTASQVEELINQHAVEQVELEGVKSQHYCLSEDAARLEVIEDDFDYNDVQLLIYFDNFMWNRARISSLFGFESKLEIYLPVEERVYGYYHLPVLYGDKLVARIEPKMDRSQKKLIIRGYWIEPEFKETEDYRDKLDKNLEDFAVFHDAETIEWLY